jgi:putative ABC transport system substrate-binding protein
VLDRSQYSVPLRQATVGNEVQALRTTSRDVTRRWFLRQAILTALATPAIAVAQSRALPRVGFLFYGAPGASPEVAAFRRGLNELGYIEGQNVIVEYRYAGGRPERLPAVAAELVRLKPVVIVTPGTPGSVAAKAATDTIPLVFAGVADAVGAGLIANLARPTTNVTGLTSISSQLGGKRLELLKAVVPKASRVAVLYNPSDPSNALAVKALQESATNLGLSLQRVEVQKPRDFEPAFAMMKEGRAHGLFGAAGLLTTGHRKTIVDLAARARIPAIWGERQFVEVGGLMSYAADFYDQIRRSAGYVDKILKGAKPSDLPVEQPTKYELVINMETAKFLGLTIAPALLLQASEVIGG